MILFESVKMRGNWGWGISKKTGEIYNRKISQQKLKIGMGVGVEVLGCQPQKPTVTIM